LGGDVRFSGDTPGPPANADARAVWGGAPGCRLELAIPPELLEEIASRAAELVLERRDHRTGPDAWPEWMSVETAARYLDVSPERVAKLKLRGELPYYQDGPGCRVSFNRRELDAWLARYRRPERP